MVGLLFWRRKKEVLRLDSNEYREGFSRGREGLSMYSGQRQKSGRNQQWKVWSQEAESIRSRAERTGRHVTLKTVREIRQ